MSGMKSLALLGIGATFGYMVAVWKFERKYLEFETSFEADRQSEEDAEDETVIAQESDESGEEDLANIPAEAGGTAWVPAEPVEALVPAKVGTILRNYNRMTPTVVAPRAEEDVVTDVLVTKDQSVEKAIEEDPTLPYLISGADFADEEIDHDRYTVCYYTKDNVVANEENEPLADAYVGKHIGWGNINSFGRDQTTMYVRTEVGRADFEILRVDGRHADALLEDVGSNQE